MQNQENFISGNDEGADLISMADVLLTIWQGRRAILAITMTAILCGLAWSMLNSTYLSQGFFQFGGPIPVVPDKELGTGMSMADYNRYSASFMVGTVAKERFANFVQEKKLESLPGITEVYAVFKSKEGLSRIIEPVYSFGKLDGKGALQPPKVGDSPVLGFRISYINASPEHAQKMAILLGHYAMDSIIYSAYSDQIGVKLSELEIRISKLDGAIIQKAVRLEELEQRGRDLKHIIARNPASDQRSAPMVTITEETAPYLPPTTLLTATEVQAADANNAILKMKREQMQNALQQEYYELAKKSLDTTKSGESFLRNLENIKERVFKNKALDDITTRQVYTSITVDNQVALSAYVGRSRFLVTPNLPTSSIVPPVLAMEIGLAAGLALSLLFVFGRRWWRVAKLRSVL